MAQHTTVALIDDLDGGKAAETVPFSLDGTAYEVDLNGRNAKAMRQAFAQYIQAGRPAGTIVEVNPVADPAPARKRPEAKTRSRKPKPAATEATSDGPDNAEADTKAPSRAKRRSQHQAAAAGPSQTDIRNWATAQGIDVAARGRISNTIRDQYLAAQTA